jgi:hypothetical protein
MGGNSRTKTPNPQRQDADPPARRFAETDPEVKNPTFSEDSPSHDGIGRPIKSVPNEANMGIPASQLDIFKSSLKLNEPHIQDNALVQNQNLSPNNHINPTKKPAKSVNFDAENKHSMSLTRNIRQTPRSVSKIMSSMDPFGFTSRYGQKMSKMSSKNLNDKYVPLKFSVDQI